MTGSQILSDLRKELKASSDEQTRKSGERFFREEVHIYGIKAATVSKIAKTSYPALRQFSKDEIFLLCEELWKSGYLEESFIACNWSYALHKSYEPADFRIFENWLNHYVSNWASCDTLCNHTLGAVIEMYPEFVSFLKSWTKSGNRWVRRGAAVSLIVPARKGKFLDDILEIASILLTDSDDMVQKGYGWMLKVASQSHLKEIFNFVMNNKNEMPRTALRYAIEKMPDGMRKEAMKKS